MKKSATFLAAAVALTIHAAQGATYYVDFEAGADTNPGASPNAPWQHAPGDPNASGLAASTRLAAGDTVLFKGGVVYRGTLTLSRSGAAGSPVTYKGDGWGTGRAVVEGSRPYAPGWTPCASAEACGGNPNFSRIYHAAAPAGYGSFLTALYENGEFLWYAQAPNPSDPFYHDDLADFYTVPYPAAGVVQDQACIIDPRVLTQTSPTSWNGAAVMGWITGNLVEIRSVVRFDPASHTLEHEPFSAPPYKDRPGRYALLNHVSLIDRAGEYAFDGSSGRVYLWPRQGNTPSGNTYAVYGLESAFSSDSAISHVTVEGFAIRHFTYGIRIANPSASNVVIRNNEIVNLRSHDKYAIHLNARDSLIEGNRVVNAHRGVGILSSADNVTIRGNHVQRTSRQGIWLMGARNSRIQGNTVMDIAGSHSNGISIYSGSSSITVSGNRIIEVNSPLTFEASSGLTFINNVIAPDGQVSDWFGTSGTIAFYNNTFAGSTFYLAGGASYVFRNNILRGAPSKGTRSHNLYTVQPASLLTGETVETDLTRLFVAPAMHDFRLREGSGPIDSGTGVPVTEDIAGVARPQGSGWDIGAHEYTGVIGGTLPPPRNLRRID